VRWALEGCIKNGVGRKALQDVRTSGPQGRTRARNFYHAFGPGSLGSSKWCRVTDFRNVKRGDVLVYNIPGNVGNGFDTGHIMIAYKTPTELGKTRDGKLVFAQKVIDSSAQPHFNFGSFKDTRSECPTSKKCGAGVGYIYVFTNSHGSILAVRIRGTATDRNAKNCKATTSTGKKKRIACFPQTNHDTHQYRIGRLLR